MLHAVYQCVLWSIWKWRNPLVNAPPDLDDKVKVVIVDSITFHFRQHFDDMALRTRVLGRNNGLKIDILARKFEVAVRILRWRIPHIAIWLMRAALYQKS
ncbi:DNA repair protein RAD51 homolog 3 isoform X2 [Tanacetum coccineum]